MDSSDTMCPTQGTSNSCGAFTCLSFFVAGVVGLALAEFFLVLYLLQRILNIISRPSVSPVSDLEIESEDNSISVQGKAWVAPISDDVDLSKAIMRQIRKNKNKEKDGQREGSRKGEGSRRGEDTKDVLEIAPVRMHAILKDHTLFLKAADGTEEKISLEGCEVLTVSSTPGPSRKWGKKFPIRLHLSERCLFHGCKTFLFFAESGYAKEAWCGAFRAVARTSPSLSAWTFKTKRKYREYTRAAEENMPYLTKFYATDGSRCLEFQQKEEPGGQSRARKLTDRWRRLTRKVSIGRDFKESKFAHTVEEAYRREESRHKHDNKDSRNKDTVFADVDHRDTVAETCSQVDPNFDRSSSLEGSEASVSVSEGNGSSSASTQEDNGESYDHAPETQQGADEPKDGRAGKEIEQGVLCLNMIIGRLYFDFNQNARRLASVERFFQRLLMKIRAPSYMKSITIKELDLGRHPPFATAVRMLPADAEGALAVEVDLQWLGGGHLTCESRLDFREQSAQEKVVSQLTESGSEQDAAAALLSGIRGDFNVLDSGTFSDAVQDGRQQGDEGSNRKGKIMSMVCRVAEKVSQVPLVLKIRLVSLKGTAVFKLKAPPTDRVWFAFKTMPEIHFEPVPCIGEHRISSGALGNLIAKQIKIQIRESVVLPYCEDFFLDWMVADKDNWLPTSAFPLPFFDSQMSQAERKHFKRNAETQSSSSDESSRHGRQSNPRPQNTHNGQNKPPKAGASQGPSKAQKHAHFTHANSRQPATSTRESNHGLLHPRRSSSDHFFPKLTSRPSRCASADHLSIQSSIPKPPRPFSTAGRLSVLSSDPAQLISKDSIPSSNSDESHKEENVGFAGDSERGTSRLAIESGPLEDSSLLSEDSISESDLQFLANQVANPEGVKEPVHGMSHTHRAKLKKMGAKLLDEGRRNVVEKLHHKRQNEGDHTSRR